MQMGVDRDTDTEQTKCCDKNSSGYAIRVEMKAAGDLLKEIKSKKHKKDPFDKNYVQHALSELKVGSEDDDRFQGLATDLKIRSEIINSQLKFLTDKVNEVSKQDDGSNKNEQRSTTVVPPIAPVESEYQEIDDIVTKKMEMLEMISSLSASELQEYCSANLSTNIPWIEGLVTNMSVERMKAYTSLVTDLQNCDKALTHYLLTHSLTRSLTQRTDFMHLKK